VKLASFTLCVAVVIAATLNNTQAAAQRQTALTSYTVSSVSWIKN